MRQSTAWKIMQQCKMIANLDTLIKNLQLRIVSVELSKVNPLHNKEVGNKLKLAKAYYKNAQRGLEFLRKHVKAGKIAQISFIILHTPAKEKENLLIAQNDTDAEYDYLRIYLDRKYTELVRLQQIKPK